MSKADACRGIANRYRYVPGTVQDAGAMGSLCPMSERLLLGDAEGTKNTQVSTQQSRTGRESERERERVFVCMRVVGCLFDGGLVGPYNFSATQPPTTSNQQWKCPSNHPAKHIHPKTSQDPTTNNPWTDRGQDTTNYQQCMSVVWGRHADWVTRCR